MCLYYFGNSSCGNRRLMFCTKNEADRCTDCQTNIQSVRSGVQGRTDQAKSHHTSHSGGPPKTHLLNVSVCFPSNLDNFPSGFYNCPVKLALEWCDHISHKWSYVTVLLIAIPCVCSVSTLTPTPQTPPRLPGSGLLRGTEEHQSLCHKSDLKPFFVSNSAVFCLFKIPEKRVQRRMRCSNKSSIMHAAGSVALDKTLISFLFLWFYK